MASIIQFLRRLAGGAAGVPAELRSGQPFVNFADGWLYIGTGDNGAGLATAIEKFGGVNKFVELLGDQNIAGIKTFTGELRVPDLPSDDNTKKALNISQARTIFGAMRINAARLDGVIDPANLPPTTAAPPVISSGTLADLTAAQQNAIAAGSSVVTTDGREWRYSGSGSKTDATSYIEMADKTPEWSVVANKPANVTSLASLAGVADRMPYFTGTGTFGLATLSSFARSILDDTSGAAVRTTIGLGTMSTQNATAVAITGGTINNATLTDVVIDCGTI